MCLHAHPLINLLRTHLLLKCYWGKLRRMWLKVGRETQKGRIPPAPAPLSLLIIYKVTWTGSGGRSLHSKKYLTLAVGPKGLSYRVTNFTLPASTLPGLDCIISVTISTQAGRREAGTGPGAHPKSAWEEGQQRPLTYTKAQADLALFLEIWLQEKVSRDIDCCTTSSDSGKPLSIL